MLRIGSIAAVLCITLAVPAGAARWTARDIATATRVADAQWPASPCRGREVVRWMSVEGLGALDKAEGRLPDEFVAAEALPWACTVRVASDAFGSTPTPDYLCSVLEHEFGHLAGYDHSTNPNSVMYPDLEDATVVCARAFPARHMCSYLRRTEARGYLWTARPAVVDVCAARLNRDD